MKILLVALWGWQLLVWIVIIPSRLLSESIDEFFWGQAMSFPSAIERFHRDLGRYPTSQEGLAALWVAPNDMAQGWKGPYLESMVKPAFGETFHYEAPGTHANRGFDFWIEHNGKIFASWRTPPTRWTDGPIFRFSGLLAIACLVGGHFLWRRLRPPNHSTEPAPSAVH